MNPRIQSALALLLSALPVIGSGSPANRLTYLDESDPFYPHLNFPRLTTPQWVGEEGVEAVVILAIDDLREPQKYELYLRPILERLKKIDGRAPVSILCNALDPQQAQFQTWLQEGLSLEVHTLSHPCPLLARSNVTAAADTYHGCVELLNRIAGNRPAGPCSSSLRSSHSFPASSGSRRAMPRCASPTRSRGCRSPKARAS